MKFIAISVLLTLSSTVAVADSDFEVVCKLEQHKNVGNVHYGFDDSVGGTGWGDFFESLGKRVAKGQDVTLTVRDGVVDFNDDKDTMEDEDKTIQVIRQSGNTLMFSVQEPDIDLDNGAFNSRLRVFTYNHGSSVLIQTLTSANGNLVGERTGIRHDIKIYGCKAK